MTTTTHPARNGLGRSGNTKGSRGTPSFTRGLIGVACSLIVWEILARSGLFDAATLPPASDVLMVMGQEVATGRILEPVLLTLQGWILGMLVVAALAIPVGVLIGRAEPVYRGVRPVFEFLRPIPGVTFLPLLLLMFGPTMPMKVWMITLAAVWPLLYQTYYGVKAIEPVTVDTAQVYHLGLAARVRKVFLPATMPFIATGFRISSSIALIVAVVAELVGGAPGIGERIYNAQTAGVYDAMYAYIGFAGILGVLINIAIRRIEKRLLGWHVLHREGAI
ncbi:ABC transporter permease [Arthrobacter mangrovi]|uniref:Nitrate ABC transporter permease n=1 Tax=Arthrobacter mangrovi TaxID=2966350 RepID=A0ABQ5MZT8_9MICC|nr:ABC transporter permease [Arthrobacter mangrovi]GLB69496.1 nitrate ABC transporter permease [Arthrobacter mangrovi]